MVMGLGQIIATPLSDNELTDNIEKKTIMNSLNESERERKGRKGRIRLEDQFVGLLPLIKSLKSQGLSHAKITEAVEEAGYKTSKGKPICKSQIGVIVRRHKI